MSPRRVSRGGSGASRGQAHLEWLRLIEVSGPFLSVPVLTAAWPDLEPLPVPERDALRQAHRTWQAEGDVSSWISFVLRDLLGWQGRRPVRRRYGRTVAGGPRARDDDHPLVHAPRSRLGRDQAAWRGQRWLASRARRRVRLARDPRRPARAVVPCPGDRAGAGHRRPLVGFGVGAGWGSHDGGRLRLHRLGGSFRTDGGACLYFAAPAAAVLRGTVSAAPRSAA